MTAMAMGGFILGGGFGLFAGYFAGRTRAEWGRGRRDARGGWDNRNSYRK